MSQRRKTFGIKTFLSVNGAASVICFLIGSEETAWLVMGMVLALQVLLFTLFRVTDTYFRAFTFNPFRRGFIYKLIDVQEVAVTGNDVTFLLTVQLKDGKTKKLTTMLRSAEMEEVCMRLTEYGVAVRYKGSRTLDWRL